MFEQGQPSKKVYVIFQGDFEIIRRRKNLQTKREKDFQNAKFITQQLKSGKSPK